MSKKALLTTLFSVSFQSACLCLSRETPAFRGAQEACTKCLTDGPPPAQGKSAHCSYSTFAGDFTPLKRNVNHHWAIRRSMVQV